MKILAQYLLMIPKQLCLETIVRVVSIFLLALLGSLQQSNANQTLTSDSLIRFVANDKALQLRKQKLEFHVQDNQTIQIGNIFVGPSTFGLHINSNKQVILIAPVQFLSGGQIVVKDASGRALWSSNFLKPEQINLNQIQNKTISDEFTQIGSFGLGELSDFANHFKRAIFLKVCVYNIRKSSRIQLCTPNHSHSFRNSSRGMLTEVNKIPNSDQQSVVMINGQTVGEHGLISFDDKIKTLTYSAKLASGTSIDLKTDIIAFKIDNYYINEDSSSVHISLRDPETENLVSTRVPIKKNFFYINSPGLPPLLQEFTMTPDLMPREQDQLLLLNSHNKTYRSSFHAILSNGEKFKSLKPVENENFNDVVEQTSDVTTWKLNNLEFGINSNHRIEYQNEDRVLTATLDVFRARPYSYNFEFLAGNQSIASVLTPNPSPSSTQTFQGTNVRIQRHFDSLNGSLSTTHLLRWGLEFNASAYRMPTIAASSQVFSLMASYRFTPGIHFVDPSSSFLFGLLAQNISLESANQRNMWFGFKYNYLTLFQGAITNTTRHHELSLGYYPFCLSTHCQNSPTFDAAWIISTSLKKDFSWHWKLFIQHSAMNNENFQGSQTQYGMALGIGGFH